MTSPTRDPGLSRPLSLGGAVRPVGVGEGDFPGDLAADPAPPLGRGWPRGIDDDAVLDTLAPDEARAVRERVGREMATAVSTLAWLTIPVSLLLAYLDLVRWRSGYFDPARDPLAPWWVATVVAHVAFACSVVPAVLIWWLRRQHGARSFRQLQTLHVTLMSIGVLGMALLAVRTRPTSHDLTVAVVMGNLLYHLPRRGRRLFNAVVVAVGVAMVCQTARRAGDAVEPAVRLVEVGGIGVLALLGGYVVRRQRIRALLMEHRLGRLALVDGLTSVATRRRVEELAAIALAAATPTSPLSVILIDIDEFKSINDTHGHNVGDEVLRGVARILQQRGRLSDVVGRWGGEEFVILCPDTPVTGALGLAEQLRARIARQEFAGVGRRSASFGVAAAAPGESLLAVVARADAALYEAKRAGRNRVREASPAT
ncbi:MAG: GGDEF domain-containing protein [Gemmatimonadetes bacterium]|nr:GGDEF domain-containing protein [Gemmatimonadota bacterium]